MPLRIHTFNQGDLLTPSPIFDFFLTCNSVSWIRKHLVVDQTSEVVTAGETGNQLVLVLEYAALSVLRLHHNQPTRSHVLYTGMTGNLNPARLFGGARAIPRPAGENRGASG